MISWESAVYDNLKQIMGRDKRINMSVKKGDKIKVIKEVRGHWGHIIYPIGSEWLVKEVIAQETGTVFCRDTDYGIPQTHYEVIEINFNFY